MSRAPLRPLAIARSTTDRLREIIEGKLVDALRAVAAQMTMDEAHEGRAKFVKEVRSLIADDLAENGLRLQSVSLTALDQTPFFGTR